MFIDTGKQIERIKKLMKIGIALGGGGAKGSYQVGVIKAIIEEGFLEDIKVVSGTSIGSINALMLMGNMSYEQMVATWEKINNKTMYQAGFGRIKNDRMGIFNMHLVYDIVTKVQERQKIRDSMIIGYAPIAEIKNPNLRGQLSKKNMELKMVCLNTAEDPYQIALASASVPIIFGPTMIGDHHYVDGGMVDNVPIQILLDEACDLIFAVSLSHRFKTDKFDGLATIIDLSPEKPLGYMAVATLDFNKKKIHEKIELGYSNTKRMIQYLREKQVLDASNHLLVTDKKTYSLKKLRKECHSR